MSYTLLFNLDLVSRMSELRPVLFWLGFFIKGKLPVQSLVPRLSPNNLIPLTNFFSVVFLNLDKTKPLGLNKIGPLRIGKIGLSGLVKTGPLRIGKNRTPPDWQNWDPSGLVKLGPLWIGKIETPLEW